MTLTLSQQRARLESHAVSRSSRAVPVLACYAGLSALVIIAVILNQVLATPIVAVGFVLLAGALVVALHPTMRARQAAIRRRHDALRGSTRP